MLIFFKSGEQCEHDMQRFNDIIITVFMHRDIEDIAGNTTVLVQGQVDLL
jgi:hypothetical protein